MDRSFMTVPEAGALIGVGRARSYVLAQRGFLPLIRFGRRLLVPRRALERLSDEAFERALALQGEQGEPT